MKSGTKVKPSESFLKESPKYSNVEYGIIWKVSDCGWFHVQWTLKPDIDFKTVSVPLFGLYVPGEIEEI
jgi:hypothetical protein